MVKNMNKKTTKKKTTTNKKSNIKKKTSNSSKKKVTKKKSTTTKKSTVKKTPVKKTSTSKKKNTVSKNKEELNKEINIDVKVEEEKVIYYQLLVFCVFITIFNIYLTFIKAPIPSISKVYLDEKNNINVSYKINKLNFNNDIYCLYTNNDKIDDSKWVKVKNNCVYPIDEKIYQTYLKNEDGTIIQVDTSKIGRVLKLESSVKKVYLPINGKEKIKLKYEKIGYVEEKYEYNSKDEKIATFKDGKIKGLSKGSTTVTATLMDKEVSIEVIVTDLITKRTGSFDLSKPYLSCNKYNKEENELLDTILKEKINNVGYKTRAGVVEAARFLTLDFPYRINYFYENGRQTTNNVDGEGRYYHVGLYLSSSKYKDITGTSKGPKIWGCSLYSRPDGKKSPNGLDCSGFVSWVLLNGGFDVKDVGAGWSNRLDLTDYGDVRSVNLSLVRSDKIKVGDLLHSNRLGGHIGIIVGLDDTNYYIAQAIWYNPVGVVITKIKKENLSSLFPHVVLMDDYYKKDGKLTNMW